MMQESLTYMNKATSDIDRLLSNMDKPKRKISPELRVWAERADQMSFDDPKNREHCVVDIGNKNYQIWIRGSLDKNTTVNYSNVEGFLDA